MQTLLDAVDYKVSQLKKKDQDQLEKISKEWKPAYPFISKVEMITSFLIQKRIVGIEWVLKQKSDYCDRNCNYSLFLITGNADFGKVIKKHLISVSDGLRNASKKIDPSYDNDYNLHYSGIRIGCCAYRAAEQRSGPMHEKSLRSDSNIKYKFSFQHLHPDLCEVYIFVVVYLDTFKYWVLSTSEVQALPNFKYYQGRGTNGIEGIVSCTSAQIGKLDRFSVNEKDLCLAVKNAYNRLSPVREIMNKILSLKPVGYKK